ncbi:MAG: ATPase [Sphingobacteriales bacterium]|nr:MAG: ATPase [Sphingobacteriales bacterium]
MAKIKCTYDFVIKSSPTILYYFLSTPSGLTQWFADKVTEDEKGFVFTWDDYSEKGEVLEDIESHYIRIKMESNDDDEFLEFRIEKSEVTDDTILIITEFVEADEAKEQQKLWATQVDSLITCVGGRN